MVGARVLPGIAGAERNTAWQTLTRRSEPDPWLAAKRVAEELVREGRWRKMPEPGDVEHLWNGKLLIPELAGEQVMIEVRVRDREGRIWSRTTPLQVAAPAAATGR